MHYHHYTKGGEEHYGAQAVFSLVDQYPSYQNGKAVDLGFLSAFGTFSFLTIMTYA